MVYQLMLLIDMIEVYKFGGSILRNSADVKKILDVVKLSKNRIIIVVSALYQVTDILLEILQLAYDKIDYSEKLTYLYNFHKQKEQQLDCKTDVDLIFDNLKKALYNCENNAQTKDFIMSFGEVLSSNIMYNFFAKYIDIKFIDSRDVIKTDSCFGHAKVDFILSNRLIAQNILGFESNVIMGGFISSNYDGITTTLGRNGSDYSAAIVANALNTSLLTMWKDVNGLYSADPKVVSDAYFMNSINYDEIKELACFGNKIIHIKTINQLAYRGIPIVIRNLYNLSNKGTLISADSSDKFGIKGVVQLKDVSIISISLIYNSLNRNEIDQKLKLLFNDFRDVIITISEIMMQDKISILVNGVYTNDIVQAIEKHFFNIESVYCNIKVKRNKSIITVVGSNLSDQFGISGKIFNVLQNNNINVDAIQDDLSETRISFILDSVDSEKAVKIIHADLF
jgi:aspartokinase/homoserine dehydrogenase 1